MKRRQKIEYWQLEPGYEFPPASYELEPSLVATYLKAVQEPGSLYSNTGLVPPMAIAAYAMVALSEGVMLPPGLVHTHGEVEFLSLANVRDTITCYSRVSQKLDRGSIHLLTIDLSVFNQKQEAVLIGKTSFVLPELNNGV